MPLPHTASSIGAELRRAGLDVRDDEGTRSMYATDASLYRIPPRAVVRPRDAGEVATALAVCRGLEVPDTARGGGTSVAGNAIGPGVVLDLSRHLNRVLSVDPDAGLAIVEPGVVQADLQKAAAPHGLRFGPDRAMHDRCTIGGMIGNNACGSRSLGYGRTAENVAGLELLIADGQVGQTGYDERGAAAIHGGGTLVGGLRAAVGRHLAVARTEFHRFGRQMSGSAVQHLLPERFDFTKALVGSESTLAVVTRGERPACNRSRTPGAGRHRFRRHRRGRARRTHRCRARPHGLRGTRLPVARRPAGSARSRRRAGPAARRVAARRDRRRRPRRRPRPAAALADSGLGIESAVLLDPGAATRIWRIREDGAGLAGRAPSGKPA